MKNTEKKIGKIIYRRLIVLVLAAFVLASAAGLLLQNYFQQRQSFTLLREYIEDFAANWDFNAYVKWYITISWGAVIDSEESSIDTFQDNDYLKIMVNPNTEWLTDISIVDNQGIVTYSSDPDMVGYDLHDSEYMSEFLCVPDDEDYYARDFYPDPFETDPDLKKVYGAVSVHNYDGLVLFGFNEQALDNLMRDSLWDSVTENRIGNTGYMIVCDMNKIMTGITDAAINEKLQENAPYAGELELPETEDEIIESVTDFYGEKCYVSAVKKPGYYLIAAYPLMEANALRDTFNVIFVITLLIVLAALFAVLYFLLKNHVVREVSSIHESLNRITAGDLDEKAEADGSLEFYGLSSGINDMVSNLKDRIRAAKEQIDKEKEKARQIQEAAVPGVFPENDAFGIYASMHTAEAVGGDFYDFFMADANTLVFVMADVCGKGMPAALDMMRAKALIKTCAEQGLPADEVALTVNSQLCKNASRKTSVTAWLGFLDLRTGHLSYVQAGHTLPVLVGKEISFAGNKNDAVLGDLKISSYKKQEMTLLPGESIYLYTDGVTEAQNMAEEPYGENRLIELIREKKDELSSLTGNALCKAGCEMVYENVMKFTGGAPQSDDITMMWVTYKGRQVSG